MLKHKIDVYSTGSQKSHHSNLIMHDSAVDHRLTADTSSIYLRSDFQHAGSLVNVSSEYSLKEFFMNVPPIHLVQNLYN